MHLKQLAEALKITAELTVEEWNDFGLAVTRMVDVHVNRQEGEGGGGQCSLASCRQVWCLLSAANRLFGITRWVSFRVRGQSSPHRAKQRLSPGRARDHPVMEIVPNKALSLPRSGDCS